jgi:hypothetical protein
LMEEPSYINTDAPHLVHARLINAALRVRIIARLTTVL